MLNCIKDRNVIGDSLSTWSNINNIATLTALMTSFI